MAREFHGAGLGHILVTIWQAQQVLLGLLRIRRFRTKFADLQDVPVVLLQDAVFEPDSVPQQLAAWSLGALVAFQMLHICYRRRFQVAVPALPLLSVGGFGILLATAHVAWFSILNHSCVYGNRMGLLVSTLSWIRIAKEIAALARRTGVVR